MNTDGWTISLILTVWMVSSLGAVRDIHIDLHNHRIYFLRTKSQQESLIKKMCISEILLLLVQHKTMGWLSFFPPPKLVGCFHTKSLVFFKTEGNHRFLDMSCQHNQLREMAERGHHLPWKEKLSLNEQIWSIWPTN